MVTMRKDWFGEIIGEFVIKIMKGPICNFGNLTSLPNIMQAFIIFFDENTDQEFGHRTARPYPKGDNQTIDT